MKALCAVVIVMLLVLIYFNLPGRHTHVIVIKNQNESDSSGNDLNDYEGAHVTPLTPPKCWSAADRFNTVEVTTGNGRCDLLLPGGGSLFYAGNPLMGRQQMEDGQEFQTF